VECGAEPVRQFLVREHNMCMDEFIKSKVFALLREILYISNNKKELKPGGKISMSF